MKIQLVSSLLSLIVIISYNNLTCLSSAQELEEETNQLALPSTNSIQTKTFNPIEVDNNLNYKSHNEEVLRRTTPNSKTYERVVLEGSRITIRCPQAKTISSTEYDDLNNNNNNKLTKGKEDKQNSFNIMMRDEEENLDKKTSKQAEGGGGDAKLTDIVYVQNQHHQTIQEGNSLATSQVRWFRNHVPILNLNLPPLTTTTTATGGINPKQPPSFRADITANNQLAHSSSLVSPSGSFSSLSLNNFVQERAANSWQAPEFLNQTTSEHFKLIEEKNKLTESPIPLNKSSINKQLENGLNFYIDPESNDLVINNVTRYFAGKYTCLYSSKISEILLDVIFDADAAAADDDDDDDDYDNPTNNNNRPGSDLEESDQLAARSSGFQHSMEDKKQRVLNEVGSALSKGSLRTINESGGQEQEAYHFATAAGSSDQFNNSRSYKSSKENEESTNENFMPSGPSTEDFLGLPFLPSTSPSPSIISSYSNDDLEQQQSTPPMDLSTSYSNSNSNSKKTFTFSSSLKTVENNSQVDNNSSSAAIVQINSIRTIAAPSLNSSSSSSLLSTVNFPTSYLGLDKAGGSSSLFDDKDKKSMLLERQENEEEEEVDINGGGASFLEETSYPANKSIANSDGRGPGWIKNDDSYINKQINDDKEQNPTGPSSYRPPSHYYSLKTLNKNVENNNNFKLLYSEQKQKQQQQQHLLPVHPIKAEAIHINDLTRLIPGFFYTKQKLYCPINIFLEFFISPNYPPGANLNLNSNLDLDSDKSNQAPRQRQQPHHHHNYNTNQDEILYPLIQAMCSPSSQSKSFSAQAKFEVANKKQETRLLKRNQEKNLRLTIKRVKFRCYNLARRLILQLLLQRDKINDRMRRLLHFKNDNNNKRNLFMMEREEILKISWFKEGIEMLFDGTSGKEIKQANSASGGLGLSNVKLINRRLGDQQEEEEEGNQKGEEEKRKQEQPDSFSLLALGNNNNIPTGGEGRKSIATDDDNLSSFGDSDSFPFASKAQKEKVWSAPSGSEKDEPTTPNSTNNNISSQIDVSEGNRQAKWTYQYPLKGRTLEIDGVRKDNSGHYTCALKFSLPQLKKIINLLRQITKPDRPIKWATTKGEAPKRESPTSYITSDRLMNDKLLCDEQKQLSSNNSNNNNNKQCETKIHLKRSKSNTQLPEIDTKINDNNGTSNVASGGFPGLTGTMNDNNNNNKKITFADGQGNNNKSNLFMMRENEEKTNKNFAFVSFLNKRVELLESILNENVSSEIALNYVSQVLFKLHQEPMTIIQTFSLSVAERFANSSNLWMTIVEAENAYTRRKMADFRRLKELSKEEGEEEAGNTYNGNDHVGHYSGHSSSLFSDINEGQLEKIKLKSNLYSSASPIKPSNENSPTPMPIPVYNKRRKRFAKIEQTSWPNDNDDNNNMGNRLDQKKELGNNNLPSSNQIIGSINKGAKLELGKTIASTIDEQQLYSNLAQTTTLAPNAFNYVNEEGASKPALKGPSRDNNVYRNNDDNNNDENKIALVHGSGSGGGGKAKPSFNVDEASSGLKASVLVVEDKAVGSQDLYSRSYLNDDKRKKQQQQQSVKEKEATKATKTTEKGAEILMRRENKKSQKVDNDEHKRGAKAEANFYAGLELDSSGKQTKSLGLDRKVSIDDDKNLDSLGESYQIEPITSASLKSELQKPPTVSNDQHLHTSTSRGAQSFSTAINDLRDDDYHQGGNNNFFHTRPNIKEGEEEEGKRINKPSPLSLVLPSFNIKSKEEKLTKLESVLLLDGGPLTSELNETDPKVKSASSNWSIGERYKSAASYNSSPEQNPYAASGLSSKSGSSHLTRSGRRKIMKREATFGYLRYDSVEREPEEEGQHNKLKRSETNIIREDDDNENDHGDQFFIDRHDQDQVSSSSHIEPFGGDIKRKTKSEITKQTTTERTNYEHKKEKADESNRSQQQLATFTFTTPTLSSSQSSNLIAYNIDKPDHQDGRGGGNKEEAKEKEARVEERREECFSDNGLDESLMWKASQYLYMHMKASASSSLFGVEVDVEWSNERNNGTVPATNVDDLVDNIDDDLVLSQTTGTTTKTTTILDKTNSSKNHHFASKITSTKELFRPLHDDDDYIDYQYNNNNNNNNRGNSKQNVQEILYANNNNDAGSVPFATVEVISGQNLFLECTAQALGRLPEVKWYKRIDKTTINKLISKSVHMKLARKIGHDIYWPLTELDILDEFDNTGHQRKRFVCSESKTIFNNLVNQTFTVINSLQLSQYNDFIRETPFLTTPTHRPMKEQNLGKNLHHLLNHNTRGAGRRRRVANNFNLYSCIVDADFRHNYATLGVHFRPTPIPLDLSKRLRARSVVTKQQSSTLLMKSPSPLEESSLKPSSIKLDSFDPIKQVVLSDSIPFEVISPLNNQQSQQQIRTTAYNSQNYDLFRETPLEFPMKNFWIPIQNGSLSSSTTALMSQSNNFKEFNLTPMMLSIIILVVFSSLLALIYLTLNSYKSLTQLNYEEEVGEHLVCRQNNSQTNNEPLTSSSSSSPAAAAAAIRPVASTILQDTDLEQLEPLLSNKLIVADDIRCHCLIDFQSDASLRPLHYLAIGQHNHHQPPQAVLTSVGHHEHVMQNIDTDNKGTNQFYSDHSLTLSLVSGNNYFEETSNLELDKLPSNDIVEICCQANQQFNECEQKASTSSTQNNEPHSDRKLINMVENPLNDESINFVKPATTNKSQHTTCFDINKEYHL